jgi:hypothetical protein
MRIFNLKNKHLTKMKIRHTEEARSLFCTGSTERKKTQYASMNGSREIKKLFRDFQHFGIINL